MLHRTERTLENIPVGTLGMIPIDGCQELGNKVNDYLVKWRKEAISKTKDDVVFHDYQKETYIIDAKVPRFGSGEAKGIINESVRGKDIYPVSYTHLDVYKRQILSSCEFFILCFSS